MLLTTNAWGRCTAYDYAPSPCRFCPLLKKSSGNPYLKICDLTQYFFMDLNMKKKLKSLVLPPLTALLGNSALNIFFALIKKIFLQTLVEIIFRYRKIFFRVLGPPWAPLRTK